MKVLVIGSGGREHAIAYKLKQSPKVTELYAIPGNPGIAEIGTCVPGSVEDNEMIIQFIKDQASLSGNQSTVCVGIALITNITNCLTLGIYIIHHMDKIQFIISVIPVTFGYSWIYSLQGTLYYVVHLLDLDLIFFRAKLQSQIVNWNIIVSF